MKVGPYEIARPYRASFERGVPRHLLELVVLVGAYFVYQVIGKFGNPNVEIEAVENALKVISWETAIGVFWERTWQDWGITNFKGVVVFLNWVYTAGYWPIILTTMVVLYIKDRPTYHYYRVIVLVSFALALAIFFIFPLAPPRLLPDLGFVDTIHKFGPVQYPSRDAAAFYNLYAAMPSLHIGWTLLLGIFCFRRTKRLPLKIFAVAYPILTFFSITLTANHYIIDAIGGAGVVLLAYLLFEGFRSIRGRFQPTLSTTESPAAAD